MFLIPGFVNGVARPLRSIYVECYRPMLFAIRNASNESSISNRKGFVVKLDVNKYSPKEITVKTIDNTIIIEGRHEEKLDEHGFVSRHFVRRYVLPKSVQIEAVSSTLSSDGILTVSAPEVPNEKEKERVIPVITTGKEDSDSNKTHSTS
ncbi:hypothetical protein J437_LFUL012997 [Ladona fulva]|uniref:SHSP domain-containing protein n=1 Tax=Ladona fulva TaxID=123851 RepID=A0A8K0KE31_LADFU|nr:hypothetical protein J437_LFUL012997 [Ladona fulva]